MPTPQSGIIHSPEPHALFLILRVVNPLVNARAVAAVAAEVPRLAAELDGVDTSASLRANVAFGAGLWDLVARDRPRKLRPFAAIDHRGRTAPSTGGDVLLHVTSARVDLHFDLAQSLTTKLGPLVEVLDEVHGFRYREGRDLNGFLDGTENPKGDERLDAALIGDEDPAFAGGSYVFTQRYVHDLKRWSELPVATQEGIVGRTKADSVELEDKPETSHVSRVVIEVEGEELQIMRHSFPYGGVRERGLFFIAYTKNPDVPERMLGRMMGLDEDGLGDRLMDFTHAVTGANFFAPSLEKLAELAKR